MLKKCLGPKKNPRWPPRLLIKLKLSVQACIILYWSNKRKVNLTCFPCVQWFSVKKKQVGTELLPLQNGHEIELSPLPCKCQQLSPLICIIWIHIKEQKVLVIYWSTRIPYIKWIGWSIDKLLPFDGILSFHFK